MVLPRTVRTFAVVLVAALGWPHGAGSQGGASDATHTWHTTLIIDNAVSRPAKAFEAFDTASLVLADINGDGQLEIVTLNDNNNAYVLDVRTGAVLAEIVTTRPGTADWGARDLNPISVGALDPSDVPCLVIPNGAAYLSAWCYDAYRSTSQSFAFDRRWDVLLDAANFEPDFREKHPWMYLPSGERDPKFDLGLDGGALIMDVDGDGYREIFVQTDGYPGQFSFDANGNYRWSRSWFDGNTGPVGVDIHRDGVKDVCFGSDGGVLACYRASDGYMLWSYNAAEFALPGSMPVAALVTDVDANGYAELFFGARNARYSATQAYPPLGTDPTYDASWINNTHAVWFLLDATGGLRWKVSYDWMNPLHYNHPAATDVNGDGVLDLIALDWNTIGHKPGNWQTTSRPPNLFVLDGRDGSVVWRQDVGAYWSNLDFVIADADGDGGQDILVPEPRNGVGAISVRALYNGERRGSFAVTGIMTRGPVAGDLFGDGTLSLVQPVAHMITDRPNHRPLDVGFREGSLVIIRTEQPLNAVFTANFLGNEAATEDWSAPPMPEPVEEEPVVNATTEEDANATDGNGTASSGNETPPSLNGSNETAPPLNGSNETAPPVNVSDEPVANDTAPLAEASPANDAPAASGLLVAALLSLVAAYGRRRRR